MELQRYFSEDWYGKLKSYIESDEFIEIGYDIARERSIKTIYPEKGSELFLKVFRVVPFSKVKVVIVGQDPYHDEGSYDGLAFSNNNDKINPSPSLKNILDEVERDIYGGFNLNTTTNLSLYRWAEQGVFLVNTAHTVIKGSPGSHLKYWKNFTDNVVKSLCEKDDIIWLLWGNHAKKLKEHITNPTHYIIEDGHPSPLNTTYPFKGCGCFSKCNLELVAKGLEPIIW